MFNISSMFHIGYFSNFSRSYLEIHKSKKVFFKFSLNIHDRIFWKAATELYMYFIFRGIGGGGDFGRIFLKDCQILKFIKNVLKTAITLWYQQVNKLMMT